MEKLLTDLVRRILRSPIFLAKSVEQQKVILDQILVTGEISREALVKIIGEEAKKQQLQGENKELREFLNSIDYNTFSTFVLDGNFTGQHLISLCNSSRKLNEYCNRAFQLINANGIPVGTPQNQYLFRTLLKRMRVQIIGNKTPRQTYSERVTGGRVWISGKLNYSSEQYKLSILPNLINIVQISSGYNCSLCLDNQGRVWGLGNNIYGELGVGDQNRRDIPTLIPDLENIVQVACGSFHSLCLDRQGRVWVFGNNSNGSLGLGDNINRNVPTLIPTLKNIIQVCGYSNSLCLDSDGRVWSFGWNTDGQLGLGDFQHRNFPVLIPNFENIIQISSGFYHVLCLDSNGKVWCFGSNQAGELGLGKDYDGVYNPTLIPNLEKIVYVSGGGASSYCLNQEGKVWCFGYNDYGNLGLGYRGSSPLPVLNSYLNNIVQVSSGGGATLCLDNQGKAWGFGSNDNKQLGVDDKNILIPILIPNLDKVIEVSCGNNHSLFIKKP